MRLHNSWSLLLQQEFHNFEKQCMAEFEAEIVAEYKRFEVDTADEFGIDPPTPTTMHASDSPLDYDDPLRAYEAFLADDLAEDINYHMDIDIPEHFDIDFDDHWNRIDRVVLAPQMVSIPHQHRRRQAQ